MTDPSTAAKTPCPQCGQPLHRWPTLAAGGYLLACDECGFEQTIGPKGSGPADSPATPSPPKPRAVHKLMNQATQPEDWPEELLDDLPEEARELLQPKDKGGDQHVSADLEQRLRGYGYFLSEDGQGARLTGEGPKPGTGDLSPLDVVRLAAELEGALPAQGERRQCPECQAMLPLDADHCQWCGFQLASDQPDSP